MIRHLFTLMWNRRRANALLVVEIFLAFVVLFAVGTIGTNLWANYRQPLGFEYAEVWQLNFTTGAQPRAEQFGTSRQLMAQIRANPQVAGAALTAANTPFSFNDSQTRLDFVDPRDSTRRPIGPINAYVVGPELREVMGLELVAGRWFGPADAVAGSQLPVVIDERMQRAMYPDGTSALGGQLGGRDEPTRRVVGVVRAYRTDGELQEPLPSIFQAIQPEDTLFLAQSVLLRVKPGSGAALEKQLTDDVRRIGPGWSGTIRTLSEMHTVQMKTRLTKPLLLGAMSVFLLLNVALGLFGVLWLNISRRRGELGVRRAMGATAGGISRQVLGEILVVTTFGLVLGLLVAVQFPLLSVQNVRPEVYFTAMLLAAGALYLLATVCALYPSRLAAGIRPAVALREE
ncbi:FtsX-like permease family protein [Hymenobacter psychrophilus]|uniref:Putative ABC transport system permease protein n=1 Tax=Hymenobacter psychrophilus TaxID=651662 RepID=A0A1H3NIU9_9BACT|nr:FtsX-like permease family protein [Hymenobacter psychrophilus]SDY88683.1 putative ABC transport system permease protein [Hymenobacter psychrophilus]